MLTPVGNAPPTPGCARPANTLVEVLIGIAILGVLIGVILPAVQQIRNAAARTRCGNNLRQIGEAAHRYHDEWGHLPSGVRYKNGKASMLHSGWQLHLLPYVDQTPLWVEAVAAYEQSPNPFTNPQHVGLSRVVNLYVCPAESRATSAQFSPVLNDRAAFTCYLGVNGRDALSFDGMLFLDSAVRFNEVRDGTSFTLLVGERPPSPDFEWGWWYAGIGQEYTGSIEMLLGVEERNIFTSAPYPCPAGPYAFGPGKVENECAVFHFWSQHPGGAHFLFGDGAVRFLRYSAAAQLPALATRSGNEPVGLDF